MKKSLNFKRFLAFSVIELVITLIAVSCLMAGFAPVIQKKIKQNVIQIHNREVLTGNDCPENCPVCYTDKCLLCVKVCSGGQELDNDSCSCVSCTDHCTKCSSSVCTKCETGYVLNNGQCNSCESGYGWNSSAKTCTKCTGSQYSNGGTMACSNCPTGTTCSGGVKTGCIEGYGWYNNSCTRCMDDDYSLGGKMNCAMCPDGTNCLNGYIAGCQANYAWNSSNKSCSYCGDAYWNNGGNDENCYSRCPEHGVCNDAGNLTSCEDGYYINNGSCISCSTVSRYLVCKNGSKYKCSNGYILIDGTCWQLSMGRLTLAGTDNFRYITRYNPGDKVLGSEMGPPIPVYQGDNESIYNCNSNNKKCTIVDNINDAVKVCVAKTTTISSCNDSSYGGRTCWVGTTSNFSTDNWGNGDGGIYSGGYSENTRTVCTRGAAEKICSFSDLVIPDYSLWDYVNATSAHGGDLYLCANNCTEGPFASCSHMDMGYGGCSYTADVHYCISSSTAYTPCEPSSVWLSNNRFGVFTNNYDPTYGITPYVGVSTGNAGAKSVRCARPN